MRPRGAGSHTVRISPILILIFLSEVGRERRGPHTRERGEQGGGGERERRGEREGRSRRAPSTTEQGGPGQATQPPTRTRTTERRERGERERGRKREREATQPPTRNPQHAPRNQSSGIRRRGRGVSMRCRGSCLLLLSSSPSSRGPRAIKRSWGGG